MQKRHLSTLVLTIIFTFVVYYTSAQQGIIRGFIYDRASGEPILFSSVYLKSTNLGAATDENGYFIITRIPEGNYTLMVTNLGYDTIKEAISIKANSNIQKKIYLKEANYSLEGISITAEHTAQRSEIRTSVVKVTPKLIKQIPSIGGQADLAQYLQILPGVVFTGDQGGQLYIRGGSPIQNKVLLDGMVIYNPFHSIGLFSVFETDILRTADVYSGGFGADMGGRISSIMDLSTRDGNKKRYSGKIGGSTFGAKLLLEGPIFKQKDDSKGSTSFLLTYKNSYLEKSSKIFYKYIDKDGLPFNFSDLYGKISLNANNGTKLNLFGFNYTDKVKYKALSDLHWESSGIGANFFVIPGATPAILEGNMAYSSYEISLEEANRPPRFSKIDGFNAGLGMVSFYGKDQLKTGVEILGFSTNFSFINSTNIKTELQQFTTEIAPYVTYKLSRNKWLIEPGLRLQYYASHSKASLEPRFALKYLASDKLRFKFAGGFYSQNFIATSSDRDVVNLFYGFLSGPEDLPHQFDGKELTHKLQKSQHIIVGTEIEPFKFNTINIEGYYKRFSQLTNMNRNKIFADKPEYYDKPEILRKDFIIENGNAYGLDVSYKYDHNNWYIWAVYSLSYINKFDGITHYAPHYDRRHNINTLIVYKFGRFDVWEANLRWNFGSGFPFTQTQGYFEKLLFPNGISGDVTTENGQLGVLYADYNKGRLSNYHRMDLGITRKFILSENSLLECSFTVTNTYNRDNIFYVDRITNQRIYQLPIMPSIGVNYTF